MKTFHVTVRGSISYSDEEWAVIEDAARHAGVGVLQYLREESGVWWNDWNIDSIEVDEL